MKEYFFAGTYTEPILFGTGEVFPGKGKGVYLCSLENGKVETLDLLAMRNPSFLCVNEEKKKVYAVNETKEYDGAFGGGVTQLSYGGEKLAAECSLPTGGTDPCHIALSPNGKFLSVANFASGSVSIFPIDEKGDLTRSRQLIEHEGHSVNPKRQAGPHAHATVFHPGENLMFVPDLGIDRVKAYRYEEERVFAAPEYDIAVPPGSGPRSGEFSRDFRFFYLINEISSEVSWFECVKGRMKLIGCAQTLPKGTEKSKNICSDLHLSPDGKYLYASNRGHDSICCFAVGADGGLTLLSRVPCGGRTPRNFAVTPSGRGILVGNQDSDTLAEFRVGKEGALSLSGRSDFPSPVCIRFLRDAGGMQQSCS
ncbi:MAG: lactonase family protein [Oscillospiraceae bacterium]|nr:lactonase family protein [Oscillospiraceae bacterium]